jgi:hypothetical protein
MHLATTTTQDHVTPVQQLRGVHLGTDLDTNIVDVDAALFDEPPRLAVRRRELTARQELSDVDTVVKFAASDVR